MIDEEHLTFLRRALVLARAGCLGAHPNPMVGCVVVKDGEVIGEGFHARYGDVHAEAAALADCRGCGRDPAGGTVYVTLEPCGHHGQQPPCAEALIAARVARVVVASEDPSPHTARVGPGRLLEAGIEVLVASGEIAQEARLLNQPFRKHALTGLPHVILKQAFTADRALVSSDPGERWVSGPESRALVHAWRAEADAVCVGIGTVLADDPLLTVRDAAFIRQPARVVFDSDARTPLDSQLIRTLQDGPVHLIVGPDAAADRVEKLRDAGAGVYETGGGTAAERLLDGLRALGSAGIAGTLFEPGATLAAALHEAEQVDELRTFHAGEPPTDGPADAVWTRSGQDQLMTARLREW